MTEQCYFPACDLAMERCKAHCFHSATSPYRAAASQPEVQRETVVDLSAATKSVASLYELGRTAQAAFDRDLADTALQIGARDRHALWLVLEWWDGLPPSLRQDIEGSGAEPGCIAHARTTLSVPSAHREASK
jgi:hypothetical protein